ncbi:uncharacterized protein LOC105638513 isoform X2 [Jatropha curcas]|uniref:uncharacterized protein LOC105638513 isoform X2 n=1 Tax=Jatropha curcas TaxID=180498 RepID=UPI0009D68023|nr:uncharacterized protein LOC105638513 isoform X2 [Jatropha curcas]
MLGCWKFPLTIPPSSINTRYRNGFSCKAETPKIHANNGDQSSNDKNNKKVVIVGSGWAGLGAANHLCNQGFDVAVLEDSNGFGSPDDVGIQGFWNPYQNIFSLVNELGITPFTDKLQSALYSTGGLEVEFPVFQDQPQLPTPLGTLYYTQFARLPLVDRLTSLPLMTAVIDFDNTDMAWRKYDSVTARELFKQFGCSKRLYQNVFGPLLQIGLFAPAEHCSAAATLGLLYYISLAHQKDFDMVWCRGTIREQIFNPWMELLRTKGCQFLDSGKVKDFVLNEETSCISEVVCSNGTYKADAVILAAGISEVQELVKNSAVLFTREEFLKVLNLAGIDVLTCKLQLDRKVSIPHAANACSAFDNSYHANELLPLKDELVVSKVMSYLSKCIKDFENANVTDTEIARFPKSLAHFFPGSYKYMMRGSTSFPNLFMAGDWIITRHGSWSQEKSYVTGLEAANRVVDLLGEGSFAKVIAVEEDEPHVEALRSLNRRFSEITEQFPLFDYFLQ